MKPLHEALEQSIANRYQLASHRREPTQYVYVYNRFYGDEKRDKMKVKYARLPGVLEVETKWSIDTPVGTFTVVCENKDGLLSPDYFYEKRPINEALRGHLHSPWIGQLAINTKIEIHFGYGERTLKEMTGLIDDVSINSEEQTITIKGRSMSKLLVDNTCKPAPKSKFTLPKKTNVRAAMERLITYAGLEYYDSRHVYEPHTNKWYEVDGEQGKRGETYIEITNKIMKSVMYSLYENQHGKLTWFKTPKFTQEQKSVYTIDDRLTLSELEYTHNDTHLYGTVLVHQGDEKKGETPFSNSYIKNDILRGQVKEKKIEYKWANTHSKRKLAALAEFNEMLYKYVTVTASIPANPALQLYDVVRLDERITTAQFNHHIRAITTTYTSDGLFQKLELASSYGYSKKKPFTPDKPINVINSITTSETDVILRIYDIGLQGDGDMIAVRYNNTLLEPGHRISKTPKEFHLKLVPGNNHIRFIGLSAGKTGDLSFTGQLTTMDGDPIGSTQSFLIPRDKTTDDLGFYHGVKPVRHWVVVQK